MKITRLNLISFGKFRNKIVNLDNRTVIFGRNEAGKSTIAAFIRIMLFGPKPRSCDRERFLPWDGGRMEGELTFISGGKEYIIYRAMGAAAKGDRISILCTSTGEIFQTLPFMSEETVFERTVFIAQQAAVFDKGTDLSTSLREAMLGGDGTRIDDALKILPERRRLITNPRGKYKGELDIAHERLDGLLRNRAAAEENKDRLPELKARLEDAEREYSEAKDGLSGISVNNGNFALAKTIFLVLSIISAVLGIALGIFISPLYFFGCVAAILLFGGFFAVNLKIRSRRLRIKRQEETARLRLDSASKALYDLKSETEKAASICPEAYDSEIAAVRREISALQQRLNDIIAAEDGIRNARSRLAEDWLPRVSETISQRASKIIGREIQVYADESLNLTVRENGAHSTDLYSGGTRDQLYLALRLAAAEIVFSGDTPPLILDDPFVQYDDIRQERAVDILLEYANKNQIIIFTCKKTTVFSNKEFNILTI